MYVYLPLHPEVECTAVCGRRVWCQKWKPVTSCCYLQTRQQPD